MAGLRLLLGNNEEDQRLQMKVRVWLKYGRNLQHRPKFKIEESNFQYETHGQLGAAHAPLLNLLKASPTLFHADALVTIVNLQGALHACSTSQCFYNTSPPSNMLACTSASFY